LILFVYMISLLPRMPKTTVIVVWCLRIILGAVFVFSGFAKCVDPWGTMYKFFEYFSVWNWNVPREWAMICGAALSVSEFCLGVLLLTGAIRRTVAWLSAVFMFAMTCITVYIYIADPVSDCGCFGDAWVISNGATLSKNIVIDIGVAYLLFLNGKVRGLIALKVQWLAVVASAFYGVLLAIIGWHVQPLVDWRPFKVGTDMSAIISEPVSLDGMSFVYEKDGVRQEFSADNIPDEDDGWVFIERKTPADLTHSAEIVITDVNGDDVSQDVFDQDGGVVILSVANPQVYGRARAMQANILSRALDKCDSTAFVAVIASDYPGGIQQWRQLTHASYDVYQADDTDLKMLARGDAALVYIKDGVVRWKFNALYPGPDFADTVSDDVSIIDRIVPVEKSPVLRRISLGFVIVMVLIIVGGRLLMRARNDKHREDSSILDGKDESSCIPPSSRG